MKTYVAKHPKFQKKVKKGSSSSSKSIPDLNMSICSTSEEDESNSCASTSSVCSDTDSSSEEVQVSRVKCIKRSFQLKGRNAVAIAILSIAASFALGFYLNLIKAKKFLFLQKQQAFEYIETPLKHKLEMPIPYLDPAKIFPVSIYTSMETDSSDSTRSSHSVHIQKSTQTASEIEETGQDLRQPSEVHVDDDEVHNPAGQHLLIDIKNVDAHFLDSEVRLSQAMIDIVNDSRLTLLSYHCHGLEPTGVSCVGVLLESHISLHTWPEDGVILLDLYTCGSNSLIPILPKVEKAFAIRSAEHPDIEPRVVWSHKLRGFRDKKALLELDIAKHALEPMLYDYKQEILSAVVQDYQLDIYDIISPKSNNVGSYEKSLETSTPTYYNENPQLFKPERKLFIDGEMLIHSVSSQLVQNEAFVHPGMVAHKHPRKVLIAGDGNIATGTLKEVLKHNTVQSVYLLQNPLDRAIQNVSAHYFPELNDCSAFGKSSCLNDTKVLTISNTYLSKNSVDLDIILSNALNIQNFSRFMGMLNNKGLLVLSLGLISDFDLDIISYLMKQIDYDTSRIHIYEETHNQLSSPSLFAILCKRTEFCLGNWYSTDTRIEQILKERQRYGASFEYFDVSTLNLYRLSKSNAVMEEMKNDTNLETASASMEF